jgi:hypothetical protein
MKKNNWVYFVLAYIVVAILLSSYFYPRTRDEFYYLPNPNAPNPFREFYDSYHFGNPRLGQFFSNLVGRNPILKPGFNVILFFGFMTTIFLLVFRKVPKIRNREDVWRFLLISAIFIFLINVFGEMFYYIPFNTNYTLTHVFYLLYLYLISEYYFYDRNLLEQKKVPYFLVFIGAFFMGWCNEHVPPVLLAGSFLLAFWYFIKNRKLPDFKILALNIPIVFGYLVLFFAPANKIKFKVTGTQQFGFQFFDYLKHWVSILKTYYYYNFELLIVFVITVVFVVVILKKLSKTFRLMLSFYFLLACMAWVIVAYSPLQGTRLLFFSNSLLIVIILMVGKEIIRIFAYKTKGLKLISIGFLIIFFTFSIFVTHHAHENYQKIMGKIKSESMRNHNVVLYETFDYTSKLPFSRKIVLESGEGYIDEKPQDDNTSIEHILKSYFRLKSISVKPK